ncbi:MAG: hypothetical protein IBJ11_10245 [Phycisphaerales bacterium]|nr:hypothetical protein [Phycisphaerales bacterium]
MGMSDGVIRWLGLAVAVLALGLGGVFATAMSGEAGRAQLVYTDQAQEGDPPEVGLGIAMGAFRGLFVNYLWLRATHLKEEGKFHEAMELSSTITRLQPRFPRVWAFHAWNMAYNISVATNTARERWDWVNAGIRLLRDEGIPRNPNDIILHRELAWIFVHKIQGFQDDANRYYKKRLAEEWHVVLGPPPTLPDDDTAAASKLMQDWFRPIVDAPATLDALIRKEMDDRKAAARPGDPEPTESLVQKLADRIRAEAGLALGHDLLRFVAKAQAFKALPSVEGSRVARRAQDRNDALDKLLDDKDLADAWSRLLPFVRQRVLVDEYHMEPARMYRYMEQYGPLDWRHGSSHAIYWAARGIEEGEQRQGNTRFNTINTDRIITHGIQELFRSGTIIYDLATDEHVTLFNLHFASKYGEVWEREQMARSAELDRLRAYSLFSAGYENFLRDVIRVFYRMGRTDDALRYYEQLRKAPWLNSNDPGVKEELMLPLDQFVRKQLGGLRDPTDNRVTVPYVAQQEVQASLIDAYYRGLLQGNRRVFESQWNYAKDIHAYYFREQSVRTTVDAEKNRMEEMPRDFTEMAGLVFMQLLMAQGTGVDLGQLNAGRIFRAAPLDLQRMVYDDLRVLWRPDPDAQLKDDQGKPITLTTEQRARAVQVRDRFDALFPQPPGMDQLRAAREAARRASDAGKKEGLRLEQR